MNLDGLKAMIKIYHGAEAIIYDKGKAIIKERIKKNWREESLDRNLRSSRIKREEKILKKLQEFNFPAPKVIASNQEKFLIEIEKIDGTMLKDVIDSNPEHFGYEIGRLIAKLHEKDIIHNDLTTANMIFKDGKIYLIDFGLSYVSKKIEDKAVDLHLLFKSFESRHDENAQILIEAALKGYQEICNDIEILNRLKKVQARGRNKSLAIV